MEAWPGHLETSTGATISSQQEKVTSASMAGYCFTSRLKERRETAALLLSPTATFHPLGPVSPDVGQHVFEKEGHP